MSAKSQMTPEERALERAKERTDVTWHVAAYVIVNLLLWFIDIAQGDGVNWAFWPTIGWGVGLAFHVASHLIDDSGMEGRNYQKFLAEERAAEERAAGERTNEQRTSESSDPVWLVRSLRLPDRSASRRT